MEYMIVWMAVSILLWCVIALYASSSLFWLYEMLWLCRGHTFPAEEWTAADVQVRILTIGRESVVQATVDALDPALDDVHVVAEKPMSIAGATVHAVPAAFSCRAADKGRAVEWARRHVPCEREYVLYLDEDTILPTFDGLPDADMVQLRERPVRTGSLLTYYAEILRMGFQLEQRSFPNLDVPLYAWGGGFAVRRSLEDTVTWDADTIIEDTTFAWRATVEEGASFAVSRTVCFNQAPPTVRAIFKQRRRWIAGSREENHVLPGEFFLLYGLRNLTWGISPVVPFLGLVPFASPGIVPFQRAYLAASASLLVILLSWAVLGCRYYEQNYRTTLLVVLLTPLLTVLHSGGALWGLLHPPTGFEVTEKVELDEVADASEIPLEYAIPLDVPYTDDSVVLVVDGDGRVVTRLETTVSRSSSELEPATAD